MTISTTNKLSGVYKKNIDGRIAPSKIHELVNNVQNLVLSENQRFAGGDSEKISDEAQAALKNKILLLDSDEISKESFAHKIANNFDINWLFNNLHESFAMAMYDPTEETLTIANDKLGKKTIYYMEYDGKLFFSTSLKNFPKIDYTIDPKALYNYMHFGFIPAPETIYTEVKKLPPGTILTFKSKIKKSRKYFTFSSYVEDQVQIQDKIESTLINHLHEITENPPVRENVSFMYNNSLEEILFYKVLSQQMNPSKIVPISYTYDHNLKLPFEPYIIHKFAADDMNKVLMSGIAHMDEPCAMPEILSSIFEIRKAESESSVLYTGPSSMFFWNSETFLQRISTYVNSTFFSNFFGEKLFGKTELNALLFHPNIKPHTEIFKKGVTNFYIDDFLPSYFAGINSINSEYKNVKVKYPYLYSEILENFAILEKNKSVSLIEELSKKHGAFYNNIFPFAKPQTIFHPNLLFKEELKHTAIKTFSKAKIRELGFFSDTELQNLYIGHITGKENNAAILWRVYVFDHWLESQAAKSI